MSRSTGVWLLVHSYLLWVGLRSSNKELKDTISRTMLMLYAGALLALVSSIRDGFLDQEKVVMDIFQIGCFFAAYLYYVFFFKESSAPSSSAQSSSQNVK
eukprot:TRINITY_DN5442_c0_g1_i1.p1 TRINITY_DN5442_c0_g1~~TRINITY_DN5442_c0_g1_i1.p1  ORF type:complete len:100 (-),score=0.45 TRINITY_DN5442_c0_g1_i1:11-310(-)